MDPFRLVVAFGPLAVYLFLLGAINLARRPILSTGGRDLAALGIAVSGLIFVGPIELFLPRELLARFESMNMAWLFWLLVAGLYFMMLILLVLTARPRLHIYNVTDQELRPLLAEVVASLEPQARWAGDTLYLPGLRVELHLDYFAPARCVALSPVGLWQSNDGWHQLEQALAAALPRLEVRRNLAGAGMMGLALVVLAGVAVRSALDPQEVAKAFFELIGL